MKRAVTTLSAGMLSVLALTLSAQVYAKSVAKMSDKDAAITAVVQLIKDGTFMDVSQVASAIGEPALYDEMLYDDDMINVYSPADQSSPFEYIRHQVFFSSLRQNFTHVTGAVEFSFKPEHCPSVAELEQISGVKAHTVEMPTSPDLRTGQGGSYTGHYFHLPNDKMLSLIGCRIGAQVSAKLS